MWVVSVMKPAWLPVNDDGLDAEVGEGHAEQRHALALAGGEQHVHLAAGMGARDLVREGDQLVGLLAHGAHDDDDVVAPLVRPGDVVGDGADALGVGDRRSAELLHEEGHAWRRYRTDCRADERKR